MGLQGDAEAKMGGTSQSLILAPCMHVGGGNEDLCVCGGDVEATL